MPRVWPGAGTRPAPGKQLAFAVDRRVPQAGRLDPLANGVVVLVARVVELPTLDVDRPAGEEVVAAAVVEVQVCVDDDVDAGEVEVLLAQWTEAGIEVGHRRVQLRHAGRRWVCDSASPNGLTKKPVSTRCRCAFVSTCPGADACEVRRAP